jgi:hypothetical protein
MTHNGNDKILTDYWSAPVLPGHSEEVGAGAPMACIATTYTFDAAFFEVELLPRFLGVKFDNTEREISFLVEREQALGTVRACVLVDHTCVDARQTTLRWDQMAVRVPGGAQHAKIVVLAWERWLRIIVSSANLTRQGYRRNREIAGVLDFFDREDSIPLQVAMHVLGFLSEVPGTGWIQAHEAAKERFVSTIEFVRSRLGRWQHAPIDFTPRELPRVSFLAGRPAMSGHRMLSVIDQVAELWGTRKARDVTVMTPFVGETEGGMERLVGRLMDLSHRSAGSVQTYLAIPGHPSQEPGNKKMISDLPSTFRDSWNSSWGEIQKGPTIYIVPPARKGEKINRILHAKGISLFDGDRDLLLCGSSNFTPHGMGVGVANMEANLCFQDGLKARDRLDARLPVRWYEDDNDSCDDVFWPAKAEPPEDESPRQPTLPPVFVAVTFNEQTAKMTAFFDATSPLPSAWSWARPGAKANDTGTILLDSLWMKSVPSEGRLTVELPVSMRGLTLTCVRVAWTDEQGQSQSGLLPVQTESLEDLLPAELFRGLTADHIMNCLISGREPAELVGENESDPGHLSSVAALAQAYDPLRQIDTTGYTLYQIRKLGQTLAVLAERLLRTVRTREAATYRLRQDPLGPIALADALAKDLSIQEEPLETSQIKISQLAFSFAEIALTLAHVCRRVRADRNPGDYDSRAIYRDVIRDLLERAGCSDGTTCMFGTLAAYISAVSFKCEELVGLGD